MPTVSFTTSFFGQTDTAPAVRDWSVSSGDIYVILVSDAWVTTETATMRGVYTFPFPVTINGVSSASSGELRHQGSPDPSVSVYFNDVAYGPYESTGSDVTIGPNTNSDVTYVLTENILTVYATLRAQRMSMYGPGQLVLENPVITVDYSERPAFCDLGINF